MAVDGACRGAILEHCLNFGVVVEKYLEFGGTSFGAAQDFSFGFAEG